MFAFNFLTWKLIGNQFDFFIRWHVLKNNLLGVIYKYTPNKIIKWFEKSQAYKIEHPFKYKILSISISWLIRFVCGGFIFPFFGGAKLIYSINPLAIREILVKDSIIMGITNWKEYIVWGGGILIWWGIWIYKVSAEYKDPLEIKFTIPKDIELNYETKYSHMSWSEFVGNINLMIEEKYSKLLKEYSRWDADTINAIKENEMKNAWIARNKASEIYIEKKYEILEKYKSDMCKSSEADELEKLRHEKVHEKRMQIMDEGQAVREPLRNDYYNERRRIRERDALDKKVFRYLIGRPVKPLPLRYSPEEL
ncbi:MAG TPA: hypothetical protein VN854_00750 [Mycoplasmatales bacterium]|nr:hypothetical protein [Mycoplasmatales bacterium]